MRKKCSECNQKVAKRECPALGESICTICCATKRIDKIECSENCNFNPFGFSILEEFRKIDLNFANKLLHIMGEIDKKYNLRFRQKMLEVDSEEKYSISKYHSILFNTMFLERKIKGKTVFEIMESENFKNLKHDEVLLLKVRSESRATILEIQQTLDNYFLKCIDLLNPERPPFKILDPLLSKKQVPRFTKIMTWLEDYPCFCRLGGEGHAIPENLINDFLDKINVLASEKPYSKMAHPQKEYLSRNFIKCCDIIKDVHNEYVVNIAKNMDLTVSVAVYAINPGSYQSVVKILEQKPDFNEIEDVSKKDEREFTWLRSGDSKKVEEQLPSSFQYDDDSIQIGILGNIKLTKERIIIECRTERLFLFAKEMADKYFGNFTSKTQEFRQDFTEDILQEIDKEPDEKTNKDMEEDDNNNCDLTKEESSLLVTEAYKNFYKNFLDEQIPALNNLTPREAADDPEMHLPLRELMKTHIHSIEKMKAKGETIFSLDNILKQLGLDDLI